jgi:hypothetical protein
MGFFDDVCEDTITEEYLQQNGWEHPDVLSAETITKSSLWIKQIETQYRVWTFGYDMRNQQLTLMNLEYPSIKTTSPLTVQLFIEQQINRKRMIDLTRDFWG